MEGQVFSGPRKGGSGDPPCPPRPVRHAPTQGGRTGLARAMDAVKTRSCQRDGVDDYLGTRQDRQLLHRGRAYPVLPLWSIRAGKQLEDPRYPTSSKQGPAWCL